MAEIEVKIPEELELDADRMEGEIEESVPSEEKRKLLTRFIDEVMKSANQLSDEELVNVGRKVKRGRTEELRKLGLM